MADIFSKEWLRDLGAWGTEQAKKLLECKLFGKDAPAGGTGAPKSETPDPEKAKKWLPFALIGAALVAVLLLFKGKK